MPVLPKTNNTVSLMNFEPSAHSHKQAEYILEVKNQGNCKGRGRQHGDGFGWWSGGFGSVGED